jgi:hypothetical protein
LEYTVYYLVAFMNESQGLVGSADRSIPRRVHRGVG